MIRTKKGKKAPLSFPLLFFLYPLRHREFCERGDNFGVGGGHAGLLTFFFRFADFSLPGGAFHGEENPAITNTITVIYNYKSKNINRNEFYFLDSLKYSFQLNFLFSFMLITIRTKSNYYLKHNPN